MDTTLYRIDPDQNMHRFYTVATQANLFGGQTVLRSWGRIGSAGQTRLEFFDDLASAERAAKSMLDAKRRRDYR